MRLRRVDCAGPGIHRVRRGRGFAYLDANGTRVTDPEVLDRVKALVIPPAWDDVWICAAANGHIQATGTDAAGRRQYRYHDAWRVTRDREKHERMMEFADRLPAARDRMAKDLAESGIGRASGPCGRRPAARSGLLPDRERGVRRDQPLLRSRDDAQRARHDRS